jgi:hypothetical protein
VSEYRGILTSNGDGAAAIPETVGFVPNRLCVFYHFQLRRTCFILSEMALPAYAISQCELRWF